MSLEITTLNNRHDKKDFVCGYPMLDNYIQKQAKQDIKRDLSACFVLTQNQSSKVLGYYTLSANSIKRATFPLKLSQKLPKSYQDLPTVLLGRLAIDLSCRGKRLGEYLLLDALNRSVEISKNLGTIAVVVDPIGNIAENFYSKYGFILLPGTAKMFIAMKTIEQLV